MVSTCAICRGVSENFAKAGQRLNWDHEPVCQERMEKAHREYIEVLKSIGLKVYEIEQDPEARVLIII